jgi:hypothetical protein
MITTRSGNFVAHRLAVSNHLASPFGDRFPLERQSVKPMASPAQENLHAELGFQVLDANRETWLSDMAAIGSPPEMLLVGHRKQILELAHEH